MGGTAVLNGPVAGTPDATVVRMCCHCHRVRTADGWRCADVPADRWVTHGICRDCFARHYAEYGPFPGSED